MLTAAGAALAGLGLAAGLAIGSRDEAGTPMRSPAVEVRTEVIRRTVHVYRREHPHQVGASGGSRPRHTPAAAVSPSATTAVARARTRASGPASVHTVAPPAPVRTASSGAHHAGGATGTPHRAVRTRASGHGEEGEHDD